MPQFTIQTYRQGKSRFADESLVEVALFDAPDAETAKENARSILLGNSSLDTAVVLGPDGDVIEKIVRPLS